MDNKTKTLIIVSILILLIVGIGIFLLISNRKDEEKSLPMSSSSSSSSSSQERKANNNEYLSEFDFHFLKLKNNKQNLIYSPLSIKYALEMLKEATAGKSNEQITNVLGSYNAKKYINNNYMSFANAMFIKDSYKDSIKDSYRQTLTDKYYANLIYDDFQTPNNLNNWVKDKTFNLINDLFSDVSDKDFILVNALAIDMEWVKEVQNRDDLYEVVYPHRNFIKYIHPLPYVGYTELKFNNNLTNAKAVEIGAVINRYNIINTLGEENIRNTVKSAYDKWIADGRPSACGDEIINTELYLKKYMEEIKVGYNDISSSTDFLFHVDSDVKVFAKNLKKYEGTTLQYIGIMPQKNSLDKYINNLSVDNIKTLINNLKSIELNNFKDGFVTEISGYIPMFKFESEFNLINNLKTLGINDVFDNTKANLSKMTDDKAVISSASHKANIEFSNEGIKAAAATELGGFGAADCGFDYIYKIPIEKIDLTFDKPFLFLIRDLESGEVWFTGSTYTPMEYVPEDY